MKHTLGTCKYAGLEYIYVEHFRATSRTELALSYQLSVTMIVIRRHPQWHFNAEVAPVYCNDMTRSEGVLSALVIVVVADPLWTPFSINWSRRGIRGDNFTIARNSPSHKWSYRSRPTGYPPKLPGPRHVGVVPSDSWSDPFARSHRAKYRARQSQCHGFLSSFMETKLVLSSKHPCGRNFSLFESNRLWNGNRNTKFCFCCCVQCRRLVINSQFLQMQQRTEEIVFKVLQ